MKQQKQSRSSTQLSALKRRVFLVVTIATPLILLLLLELGLRLFTRAENLSLFTTEVLAGRTYHVMNPGVKGRYFANVLFNPSTSPDYFEVPKPDNTFRIFCLGGSTTVGYPYWYNGSFSSFLRDRLRTIFPDRRLEVINVGMTATNSFTVNDMARELSGYAPDLLIVYDGHNEFYGALGVASHESFARSRWLTKAYLRLIHFRTFTLLQNAVSGLSGLFRKEEPTAAGSTMMEKLARGQYIPYDSELYADGLRTYSENLQELIESTVQTKTPLLLGAQVSNLRDLPPFVSEDGKTGSGKSDLSEFVRAFNAGTESLKSGKAQEALREFSFAVTRDSTRADGHYSVARCLDVLGRHAEAQREYIKARDYDMLRFRMSTDFNNAMRSIGTPSRFVDMEDMFRRHSKDSLIGKELIVEHLHPNSSGFFLMAKAYASAMRRQGFLASPEEWSLRDTISDDVLWNSRPVTELDERIAARRTEILTSGWPFENQVPAVFDVAADDTIGLIAERVTKAQWNWKQAHNAAAEYYLERQDWENAKREYRVLINQLPLVDVQPYLKLARLYLSDGDLNNAREYLQRSLDVSQTILAHRALGDIAMQQKRPDDAVASYEKTLAFSTSRQERIENGHLLALACSQAGLNDRASFELLQVLALKPDFQPAVELLAKLNEPR